MRTGDVELEFRIGFLGGDAGARGGLEGVVDGLGLRGDLLLGAELCGALGELGVGKLGVGGVGGALLGSHLAVDGLERVGVGLLGVVNPVLGVADRVIRLDRGEQRRGNGGAIRGALASSTERGERGL
ncbi:hypothetical protein [Corynebacterium striatum]|uniref:hypothetical protein n=1 Tax=Corynebacterium striatum TaxID=43770 RepID=UPI00223C7239|nr:hypothetical protein [Corynebacterium striatum]